MPEIPSKKIRLEMGGLTKGENIKKHLKKESSSGKASRMDGSITGDEAVEPAD